MKRFQAGNGKSWNHLDMTDLKVKDDILLYIRHNLCFKSSIIPIQNSRYAHQYHSPLRYLKKVE